MGLGEAYAGFQWRQQDSGHLLGWCQLHAMLLHTGSLLLAYSDCIAVGTKRQSMAVPLSLASLDTTSVIASWHIGCWPCRGQAETINSFVIVCAYSKQQSLQKPHCAAPLLWETGPECSQHIQKGFHLTHLWKTLANTQKTLDHIQL